MKPNLILTALILFSSIFIITGCKQKPKTDKEIYDEKMETYTDEQLLQDYYGTTQNYKVTSVTTKSSCPNADNKIVPNVKYGAVIPVLFNKGKVYIKDVGTIYGSYEKGYYANGDGSIVTKFMKYESAGYANIGKTGRSHPSEKSEYLSITIEGQHEIVNDLNNLTAICKATIIYTLTRLEDN